MTTRLDSRAQPGLLTGARKRAAALLSSPAVVGSVFGAASVVWLYAMATVPALADERGEIFLSSPRAQVAALAVVAVLTAAACARRRAPTLVYLATIAGTVTLMLHLGDRPMGATPLYWLAVTSLAARVTGGRLGGLVFVGIAADFTTTAVILGQGGRAVASDPSQRSLAEVGNMLVTPGFNIILTYGILVVVGKMAARHRRLKSDSASKVTALRREREQRVREAVEQERSAMARELHDIAAHDLAGMIIQAKAADMVLVKDLDRGRSMLSDLIVQGERTLTSMRQIVGILRLHDPGQPQPSIAEIAELAENARQHGIDTALRSDGDFSGIDNAVQLACYRIVQESLANIRQHAPGASATVSLRRTPAAVLIEVANTTTADSARPGGHQGFGIVGMRERAVLLGGTLDAGPVGDGWHVTATVPLEGRITQW